MQVRRVASASKEILMRPMGISLLEVLMRMRRLSALSLAGLLVSGPIAVADPAQTAAPAAVPAPAPSGDNDPDRIVCRSGTPPTGTRIPGPRVCHTQREWDDMRRQSQEQLTKMQAIGSHLSN